MCWPRHKLSICNVNLILGRASVRNQCVVKADKNHRNARLCTALRPPCWPPYVYYTVIKHKPQALAMDARALRLVNELGFID